MVRNHIHDYLTPNILQPGADGNFVLTRDPRF